MIFTRIGCTQYIFLDEVIAYVLYSYPYLLSCNFTDLKGNVFLHATISYVHYDNCKLLPCTHTNHK